jgi:hypothetical protein
MQKHYRILIFVFIFAFSSKSFSQWGTNLRLTNDSAISKTCLNNGYSIAASGDTVHIVWQDNRDSRQSIYYKRSLNGGLNWSADELISGAIGNCNNAVIFAAGNKVHVAFISYSTVITTNYFVYYKRSTNAGNDWASAYKVAEMPDYELHNPSIAVTENYVHLSWQLKFGSSTSCINYRRSTDDGATWGTNQQLSVGDFRGIPSICASGNNVLIVCSDNQYGDMEITCSRSTNAGTYWSSSRLTNETGLSQQPSISISGLTAIVVWIDYRDGSSKLYQKRTTNAGSSWYAESQLTSGSYIPYMPNIQMSGSYAHVVWYDSSNSQLYYLRGLNYGSIWQTRTQLTETPHIPYNATVTASGNIVHVLWTDNRHGEGELYYKRNPTGNAIGITQLCTEIPVSFNLYQNYPNPFNPVTKIKFDVPKTSFTKIIIYDILGREVTTLVNEELKPGSYEVDWSAEGGASEFSSGVYFYKITAGDYSETKKMVLMK